MFFEKLQLIIGYAGVINGIVLAAYLLLSKIGNIESNRILGFFILAITIKMSYAITSAQLTGYYGFVFYLVAVAGYYSIGPLMFLFFLSRLKKLPKNRYWITLHFLPAIYVLLLLTDKLPYVLLNLWLTQAQIATYLVLSLIFLIKIKNNQAYNAYKSEYIMLRNVIIGVACMWGIVCWLIPTDFKTVYLLELGVLFTILLYVLMYSSIKSRWFRNGERLFPMQLQTNSGGDENKLKLIMDKADTLMEREKCFENPEINLPKLAQLINESTHGLSESINRMKGMSFNDYVNSFRIEKAKEMLLDPGYGDSKIAGIAYDCGFNTLSTFNLAFKKFTQTTPTKFRESALVAV
jgi:AraC-like DNA-binding protein